MATDLIARAAEAVRTLMLNRAEEYGSWITDRHPETGVWSYEGEIPDADIVRAVLIAIRELSDDEVQAGFERGQADDTVICPGDYGEFWSAMIDAALQEKE